MHINTLSGRTRASNEALRPGMGETFEEFEAELHSAIAKLHVSDENVTASDSHISYTEMSAAMHIYTESQIRLHAGSATRQQAGAAPRRILDLLR